jgi:hypothetical protein
MERPPKPAMPPALDQVLNRLQDRPPNPVPLQVLERDQQWELNRVLERGLKPAGALVREDPDRVAAQVAPPALR